MGIFAKFRQWHNGGLVKKKPVVKPVKRVKPLIKIERLASGILFYRVENIPLMDFNNSDWDAAYYWTTRRNQQEVAKYLAKMKAKDDKSC